MNRSPNWREWQRAGTAATIAVTSTTAFGRLQRRRKGARHAHDTILASGRIPGEEARAARKRYAAERRAKLGLPATATWAEYAKAKAKVEELESRGLTVAAKGLVSPVRYSYGDLTGI